MRYLRFAGTDGIGFGFLHERTLFDLSARFESPEALVSAWHSRERNVEALLVHARRTRGAVNYLPPFSCPRYFCIGLNYPAHRTEVSADRGNGKKCAEHPTMFIRNPDSVVGHNSPIRRGRATECYDFEGELAVVIGGQGRATEPDQAIAMIAGYTCFMDGTARDYQEVSVGAGKNFDMSGAVGPWVAPAGEVPDPQALTIDTRVNGISMQHAETSTMLLSVADIIMFLSSFVSLKPGDVIATGSPAGVGMSRSPPVWLSNGDTVEVEISSIGTLTNRVTDDV